MDFTELYERQKDRIFQLAYRLLGDRDRAADAVQETFTRAFAARASFRGEARPATWLFRIAYNLCLSRLADRREKDQGLGDRDWPEPSGRGPESGAERGEVSAEVRAALARLDEEDRRILCLRLEEDLDFKDLGEILECSPEAARQRYCRARKRLRDLLRPFLGEGS